LRRNADVHQQRPASFGVGATVDMDRTTRRQHGDGNANGTVTDTVAPGSCTLDNPTGNTFQAIATNMHGPPIVRLERSSWERRAIMIQKPVAPACGWSTSPG
jgi:hypothetical protein